MSKLAMIRKVVGLALLAAALVIALAPTKSRAEGNGVVTAQSRYGVQRVQAPVRPGRRGFEVRLPGGTWVNCRRDCAQTLREETVDFWQTQRERGRR